MGMIKLVVDDGGLATPTERDQYENIEPSARVVLRIRIMCVFWRRVCVLCVVVDGLRARFGWNTYETLTLTIYTLPSSKLN